MRRFQIMCGLLAVAVTFSAVATASAQDRRRGSSSRRGFSGSRSVDKLTLVARSEKVQKELKLDEEATKQVKSLSEEFSAKRREAASGIRDLPREEQRAAFTKIREATRKLSAEYGKKVDAVLGKEKSARLSQIALWAAHQSGGISLVLRNDALAKTVKLTGEQKEKLQAISTESREALIAIFRDQDTPREERTKKREALTEQTNKKVKELLTEDQTAAIKTAMGEKFEVDLRALRGSRRGGNRGGATRRRRPGTDN